MMIQFALATLFLATGAAAQSKAPQLLLGGGDLVPGAGKITDIYPMTISDAGDWSTWVLTDDPNPDRNGMLLRNGEIWIREGDGLPSIPGSRLLWARPFDYASNGDLLMYVGYRRNSQWRRGIAIEDEVFWKEGDLIDHPDFTPGTRFREPLDARINSHGQVLVLAEVDDPAVVEDNEQALFLVDVQGGSIANISLIARSGELLPGLAGPVSYVDINQFSIGLADTGDVLFAVYVYTGVYARFLFRNQELIEGPGMPSPVPGFVWDRLQGCAMGPNGDIAYAGYIETDSGTDIVIAKNGELLYRQGAPLASTAPAHASKISTTSLSVDKFGRVLWIAGLSESAPPLGDVALMRDTDLILRTGELTDEGTTVDHLQTYYSTENLSHNGHWALARGFAGGQSGMILKDLSFGSNLCLPGLPNSTGEFGEMGLTGYSVAGGPPLTMVASQLPPNQFAFFLASKSQASVPMAGGGQGTLCLGGSIARFSAGAASTGSSGYLQLDVDTSAIPLSPTVAILPGEVWTFQCWHRDLDPGPTSNLTFSATVQFQ